MKEKSLEIKRMHIKYVFTEDEKVAMAGELAQKMSEKTALRLQKKEVASKLAFDINSLDAALMRISGEYRQGYAWKNHDCYEVFDYDTKQVFTHRADTDEQAGTRTMTTGEAAGFNIELYQPTEDTLDDNDPPGGDSGVPVKKATIEYLNDELIKDEGNG